MTTDAMNDTYQAIRLVRSHAIGWGLDPKKIGIMGFSAGAELAATAALTYDEWDVAYAAVPSGAGESLIGVSSRPDFAALLYPGPTPFRKDKSPHAKPEDSVLEPPLIPQDVPPTFIASPGTGDRIHAIWATEYFSAMLEAGVPNIEMHIYGNGTHGGGLTYRHGTPLGSWTDRFIEWFADLGFMSVHLAGEQTKAALDVASFARGESVPQ
jgi:acetyl esterase/lipase|eukprot:COSAG02_NODE_2414_length_8913_cov_9.441116_4_plen_211_part_00